MCFPALVAASVSEWFFIRSLTLAATLVFTPARAAAEPVFRHAGFAPLAQSEYGNADQILVDSARSELKLNNWFDLDGAGTGPTVTNLELKECDCSGGYFSLIMSGERFLLGG